MLVRYATRRGQPLLVLGLVIVCWVFARTITWDGKAFEAPPSISPAGTPLLPRLGTHGFANAAIGSHGRAAGPDARRRPHARKPAIVPVHPSPISAAMAQPLAMPFFQPWPQVPADPPQLADAAARTPSPARPPSVDSQEFYEPLVVKDDPRWSGENWLLMRAGSGAAAQAPGAASYGASQAGAIVRYRFGKGEPRDSYAYLRTSLAINAPGKDKEIALGFGARPIRRLPLRALAEVRLQDTSQSPMQVRPVATLITEIPWKRLPHGFRLETYGQAGYAGGRNATAFFDAQALVDHPVRGVVSRNGDLRAGLGIWSGGQMDAVRLDLGPRVAFRLEGGRLIGPTRVALDWRFRVAGNARPGSGPTMTVSSAF